MRRLALGMALAVALGAGIGIGVAIDSDEPESGRRENQINTPWRLESRRGRALLRSRVLLIEAWHGGCLVFDHVEVEETDTTVTLTALSNDLGAQARAAGKPVECTLALRYTHIPVTLNEPLGNRELKAAPISDEWNGPTPQETPS